MTKTTQTTSKIINKEQYFLICFSFHDFLFSLQILIFFFLANSQKRKIIRSYSQKQKTFLTVINKNRKEYVPSEKLRDKL